MGMAGRPYAQQFQGQNSMNGGLNTGGGGMMNGGGMMGGAGTSGPNLMGGGMGGGGGGGGPMGGGAGAGPMMGGGFQAQPMMNANPNFVYMQPVGSSQLSCFFDYTRPHDQGPGVFVHMNMSGGRGQIQWFFIL